MKRTVEMAIVLTAILAISICSAIVQAKGNPNKPSNPTPQYYNVDFQGPDLTGRTNNVPYSQQVYKDVRITFNTDVYVDADHTDSLNKQTITGDMGFSKRGSFLFFIFHYPSAESDQVYLFEVYDPTIVQRSKDSITYEFNDSARMNHCNTGIIPWKGSLSFTMVLEKT